MFIEKSAPKSGQGLSLRFSEGEPCALL